MPVILCDMEGTEEDRGKNLRLQRGWGAGEGRLPGGGAMGAKTKDQTPELGHSICRDPNGSWNTLCFQGTRILVILLYRIYVKSQSCMSPIQSRDSGREGWEGNSHIAPACRDSPTSGGVLRTQTCLLT